MIEIADVPAEFQYGSVCPGSGDGAIARNISIHEADDSGPEITGPSSVAVVEVLESTNKSRPINRVSDAVVV